MVRRKFVYNSKTLRYEPIKPSLKSYLKNAGTILILSLILAFGFTWTYSMLFDSPEEVKLKNQNNKLETQLYVYGQKLDSIHFYLSEVQQRDDELYRVLLGEDPISKEIRLAGIGGSNSFRLDSESIISQLDMDKAKARVAVQRSSLDELTYKANQLAADLESRPKITPIRKSDIVRFTSGFGFRTHPIYHVRKFHEGIDITARKGTPVYAASAGKVIIAGNMKDGYGNKVVIDHGNGYRTLYAHLDKILVKWGQEVNLAQQIGKVGNTGGSVSPHLHYEVQKNNYVIDPLPYLYSQFSDEEFDELVALGN
jgi:murein DD-endopeptidase MepM/ murein hydrolase activator NlpD